MCDIRLRRSERLVQISACFTAVNVRFREIVLQSGGAFNETVRQTVWMSLRQHQAGLSAQQSFKQSAANGCSEPEGANEND